MTPPHGRLDEIDAVTLYRGGTPVVSLLGAFGSAVRETRLTAMLGLALSRCPEELARRFGFEGRVQSVSVEHREAQAGRSDIRVETTQGIGVIEAKCDATDPFPQASRYPAKWHVLITRYVPAGALAAARGVRYVRWHEVAEWVTALEGGQGAATRFLLRQFRRYLEEHGMINRDDVPDIYAREINDDTALDLFLEAWIYVCRYEAGGRLGEAGYFAPHFGKSLAQRHPSVRPGISYVAKIEAVAVAGNRRELFGLVREQRGRTRLNQARECVNRFLHRWRRNEPEKRSVVFLGEPRLVFNPPIDKTKLQKGRGFLSRRTFSFDELFAAWL